MEKKTPRKLNSIQVHNKLYFTGGSYEYSLQKIDIISASFTSMDCSGKCVELASLPQKRIEIA